jgi:hypothetical protein
MGNQYIDIDGATQVELKAPTSGALDIAAASG